MACYTKNGHWKPTIAGQTCAHCEATFTAHRHGQRFCSNACKFQASKKCTVRSCENCGASFEATGKRKVCSKDCQYGLIRNRGREKCRRVCVICDAEFYVPKSDHRGKTCSPTCLKAHQSQIRIGTTQSAETIAKRSVSLKKSWADDEVRDRRLATHAAAIERWHSDPDNAAAFAQRSSERMRQRHQDPEFQKRRDERSSRTMKANWDRYRDQFLQQASERYQRMVDEASGLLSDEARRNKAEANKWIMKQAQKALHLETDIDEKMSELQYRLRLEMPYDGPADSSDYLDYCQKLCRAITTHPEYRVIADTFMSDAIPRFANEWNRRKVTQDACDPNLACARSHGPQSA